MKFLTTNLCTEAATTVSASSSDPSFPVSNLKHPFRSKRWRSTDCEAETIVFDMKTVEPVDSVVILWPKEDGIKLTSEANIRIQGNATNVWTSPAFDQAVPINNDYMMASVFFPTDQNYRYWRIVVFDPSNPWGYIEIGQIWVGKSLTIANAENGFKFTLVDRSKVIETDFGHKYVDEMPISTTLEISYKFLDYSEVQIIENAFRRNGIKKPVLLVVDPESQVFNKDHFSVYGMMSNKLTINHAFFDALNIPDIVVEELS